MNQSPRFIRGYFRLIVAIALSMMAISCGKETAQVVVTRPDQNDQLGGIWVLQSRLHGDKTSPAEDRQMKLFINENGTFKVLFRADANHNWIQAGQGAFLYAKPALNFYWESGQQSTLLVLEKGPDKLVLHHGRCLAPLANQDPDEVYVKEKSGSS